MMEVGRWSKDKLRLLGKYLKAYSMIMNRQKGKWLKAYHYIDAFAGTGEAVDRETRKLIDGSVKVALDTEPPFDMYWFIEKSSIRIKKLEELKKKYPFKDIKILQGDSNKELWKITEEISKASNQRGIVFLDPYGLQVKWSTVERLGKSNVFDIFINFSLMGIIRNLPKNKEPNSQITDIISGVIGNNDWINEIYYKSKDLFGDNWAVRNKINIEKLVCLYTNQVKGIFEYLSKPVIMRNSKNAPIYALILASHKHVARKIMDEIEKDFHERVNCIWR